jgi:uncharacterized protein YqeY
MLKEQIQADTKESMKAGNSELTGLLRMMSSAISQKGMDKRYAVAKEKPDMPEADLNEAAKLSDEEIITVLAAEIKKRRDAIALFEQGGRPELAETEKKEITMIQKYLPEQLSPEELRKLVAASIEKTGATEMKDTGKIMADLMPQVKGKAENSEISKIIKELLAK